MSYNNDINKNKFPKRPEGLIKQEPVRVKRTESKIKKRSSQ